MSDIAQAIKGKQAAITMLQSDIDVLGRAASIITPKAAGKKRIRRKMSAAARKAVGKRMKAYWAAKR